MGFTQGAPLPDITKTTTKDVSAPGYYTDYLTDLSKTGTDYLDKTAQDLVAGYDPLQTSGYDKIKTGAGAYSTGLTEAEDAISGLTGGFDVDRISEFMDPYKENVVEEMERKAQQQLQRSVLPTLKAGFVGSGGLGSQRYAGALGQALADVQANLTGQTYGALSSGYKDAMDAALREYQMETQAAQTQANIAKLAQDLGITESEALRIAGAEKQAYEQSKLDAPLKTATNVSKLLSGYQVPLSSKEVFVGPEAGSYQTSDLANLAGILSIVGSGAAGTAGNRLTQGFDWLTNKLGFSATPGEVANSALPGQPGYGWSYYDNGTAISPDGEYYFNGELVWSPGDN